VYFLFTIIIRNNSEIAYISVALKIKNVGKIKKTIKKSLKRVFMKKEKKLHL